MEKIKFPSQSLKTLDEIKKTIDSGASFAGGGLEVTEGTEAVITGNVQGILYSGLREDGQQYKIVNTFVVGDITTSTGKTVANVRAEISQNELNKLTNDDQVTAHCIAVPYTKKGDEKVYYKLAVKEMDSAKVAEVSAKFNQAVLQD